MPNPYTFIPGALPQAQTPRIYGEVGTPAPTAFTDPLVIISPDWTPDIPLAHVTEWPADHGSVLPVVGDTVLLEQDSRGTWRVASWGHATTTWGGVTLPTGTPSTSNQAILSNGAGGSFWGAIAKAGLGVLALSVTGPVGGQTFPGPVVLTGVSGTLTTVSASARVLVVGQLAGVFAQTTSTAQLHIFTTLDGVLVDCGSSNIDNTTATQRTNSILAVNVYTGIAPGAHTVSLSAWDANVICTWDSFAQCTLLALELP